MADTLTIEGVLAYSGEYPLDISYFTNRELHLIKEVSGVRAGELQEAFAAGDNDLIVAVAAISIWRKTGTKPNMDALWDAPSGKFVFNMETVADEEEGDDESIPLPTEPDEEPTQPSEPTPDGKTSNGTSEIPESVRSLIGTQG